MSNLTIVSACVMQIMTKDEKNKNVFLYISPLLIMLDHTETALYRRLNIEIIYDEYVVNVM